ncbi:MAG TPA: PKD domain-containing protein [Verrucomicrobiota bacterium]|nr:PKD domain-containing protein [Verrucomicrobiota bacterium]
MKTNCALRLFLTPCRVTCLSLFTAAASVSAANNQMLGWNNLGMHCMDSDYSVFSILPPYNTIECQLVVSNRLVTNAGVYTVTYQAVADPTGSINTTAMGKGNFYQYDELLFGVNLTNEAGLAGWAMPGTNNTPQLMAFERTNSAVRVDWWRAEGIPIAPYDDAGRKNTYPMMRLIAKRGATPIATNDIVLPVSDEMDCRLCHASGTQAAAQPAAGWVWSANPERDYRLNILRLHDESQFSQHAALYNAALAAKGFNPQGLYRGVVADGKPVLCAACHASEALGTGSYSNIPPLTAAIHSHHAPVTDPELGITLDNSLNREACYRCHPGSTTKCLRGAMGASVASNGMLSMQCQSCHGNMSHVGAANRVGWLNEPNCQSCHVGNALANGGVRFTSSFIDTNWTVRAAVDSTFATDPNTPPSTNGYSLYRFSSGHGNLQCSACHGSTHAEFPSSHANDNVRNFAIQGHVGMVNECVACHNDNRSEGGPHGMHATDDSWASGGGHGDAANASCRNCHGNDGTGYGRGTELSELKSDHIFSTGKYGAKGGWRGYRVGCYTCHNGTSEGSATPWKPASIASVSTNTTSGAAVLIPLPVRDTNTSVRPLTVRVISQPTDGTVGITNWNSTNWAAIYFPDSGFVGTNRFTYAAWNGYVDSALRTGTVSVAQGTFAIAAKPLVPPSYPAQWVAPFSVVPSPSNIVGAVTFDWDFGDATPHSTNQYASHAYAASGNYNWKIISQVQNTFGTSKTTNSGSILIGPPVNLAASRAGNNVQISWSQTLADALVEQSSSAGPGAVWTLNTGPVASGGGQFSITVTNPVGSTFYRLRKL